MSTDDVEIFVDESYNYAKLSPLEGMHLYNQQRHNHSSQPHTHQAHQLTHKCDELNQQQDP